MGRANDSDPEHEQQKSGADLASADPDQAHLDAEPPPTEPRASSASAATKSISTDDDLTLPTMKRLADSLKRMSAGKVRFVTVPVERYAPTPTWCSGT